MTNTRVLVQIDHAAAEAVRNGIVKDDAFELYGPTIADQRDRAAIGGGVAYACVSCALKAVTDGDAILDRSEVQS
jgi:hypothetical protein